VQVGSDIGKLNLGGSGANLHFGVTGGALFVRANDTTPAGGAALAAGDQINKFEIPFIGLYAAFAQGSFSADVQVRWDYYLGSTSSELYSFSGDRSTGQAFTVTSSAGYRIALADNWFIEPNIGGSWSRLREDPVSLNSSPTFGYLITTSDITSLLGRASVRVGTSFQVGQVSWQPFVVGSVVHEFAGSVKSSTQVRDVAAFPGGFLNGLILDSTTDRIGTYGQVGVGTAVVLGNSGWLGYGRFDYKNGEKLEGYGVNFGLRYQW
jgi:hypothetical protein